jgi:hypothetical protein
MSTKQEDEMFCEMNRHCFKVFKTFGKDYSFVLTLQILSFAVHNKKQVLKRKKYEKAVEEKFKEILSIDLGICNGFMFEIEKLQRMMFGGKVFPPSTVQLLTSRRWIFFQNVYDIYDFWVSKQPILEFSMAFWKFIFQQKKWWQRQTHFNGICFVHLCYPLVLFSLLKKQDEMQNYIKMILANPKLKIFHAIFHRAMFKHLKHDMDMPYQFLYCATRVFNVQYINLKFSGDHASRLQRLWALHQQQDNLIWWRVETLKRRKEKLHMIIQQERCKMDKYTARGKTRLAQKVQHGISDLNLKMIQIRHDLFEVECKQRFQIFFIKHYP